MPFDAPPPNNPFFLITPPPSPRSIPTYPTYPTADVKPAIPGVTTSAPSKTRTTELLGSYGAFARGGNSGFRWGFADAHAGSSARGGMGRRAEEGGREGEGRWVTFRIEGSEDALERVYVPWGMDSEDEEEELSWDADEDDDWDGFDYDEEYLDEEGEEEEWERSEETWNDENERPQAWVQYGIVRNIFRRIDATN